MNKIADTLVFLFSIILWLFLVWVFYATVQEISIKSIEFYDNQLRKYKEEVFSRYTKIEDCYSFLENDTVYRVPNWKEIFFTDDIPLICKPISDARKNRDLENKKRQIEKFISDNQK